MIGLVLCLAGIAGCWRLYAEVSQRLDSAIDRAESLLVDVQDSLDQIGGRLRQTQQELDAMRQRQANPATDPPGQRTLRDRLSRKAIASAGPQLGMAREKLVKATEIGLVLNGLLDALAELSLVERAGVATDRLQESSDRLGKLIEQAEKLASRAAGSEADQPDATPTEESSRLARLVGQVIAAMEEGADRVSRVRERIVDRHAHITNLIAISSVAMTIVLIWIALGQFSLLVHGRALACSNPHTPEAPTCFTT
jgi:hypothetical protein